MRTATGTPARAASVPRRASILAVSDCTRAENVLLLGEKAPPFTAFRRPRAMAEADGLLTIVANPASAKGKCNGSEVSNGHRTLGS